MYEQISLSAWLGYESNICKNSRESISLSRAIGSSVNIIFEVLLRDLALTHQMLSELFDIVQRLLGTFE